MTIKELKKIISNLPEETIVQIEENNVNEVGLVNIVIHSDGRSHIVLSAFE
jgi:hypothetical protein